MTNGREFNETAIYEIRIKGSLGPRWSDWFDGSAVTRQANDETVLSGQVADQPSPHGPLAKIRDLDCPYSRSSE